MTFAPRDTGAQHSLLVTPEWLESHLGGDLTIVDTGEPQAYRRAHIPGAVHVGAHPYLKTHEGGTLVMDAEPLEALARTWGVRNDRTVIVYDDDASRHAARAWWVLRHYGHPDVRVLDGGIDAWLQQGRSLIFEAPQPEPGDFIARETDSDVCTIDQLKAHAASGAAGGMQIWDARSDAEWRGAESRNNARVGHVPGALNLEWLRLTTGPRGRFQPLDQIRSMLADAGIDPSVPTVTYCQGGIRAAFAAFVLAMLGNDSARNYDGSMKEWANREDTPLVVP